MLELDSIVWHQDRRRAMRPASAVQSDLRKFQIECGSDGWVIEGVYSNWIQSAFNACHLAPPVLVWLDTPPDECASRVAASRVWDCHVA